MNSTRDLVKPHNHRTDRRRGRVHEIRGECQACGYETVITPREERVAGPSDLEDPVCPSCGYGEMDWEPTGSV